MIKIILFILFFISLTLKIIFSIKKIEILKYILTPLTTIIIMAFPFVYLINNHDRYTMLVLAALVFSLVGDVFNMMENGDQTKLQFGMIFFVFAHLIYIYNFIQVYSFAFYQIIIAFAIVCVLLLTFFIFRKNFKTAIIKYFIGIYMIIVSTMVFIAIGNLTTKITIKTILISIGSVLFWLSDLVLGVDAFWKKLKLESLFVWGLYAPAQLLIALSCFY